MAYFVTVAALAIRASQFRVIGNRDLYSDSDVTTGSCQPRPR
jgi:hypothetical protein